MKVKIKKKLIRILFVLSQFGLNPLRFFLSIRGVPSYISDKREFKKLYRGKLLLKPCLYDRYEEGGTSKSEYFWQDLIVAQWIHDSAPDKHVDIGSRLDGFVAHVASFRNIEVFDIRQVTTKIPGVTFKQADLMDDKSIMNLDTDAGYCDSLSCLHVIEHFGLGRYGDPVDPRGFDKGLCNMAKLLKKDGIFYLSTPIGIERVEFNANWVFDPKNIERKAREVGLKLKNFHVFNVESGLKEYSFDNNTLSILAQENYNLGIFTFIKTIIHDV